MGSNLSLNTKYKITIHPEIWIQKSNNVKKTKKNNGNNTLEISNADKTKYITRLIKSSKFKSILKYATHITNISEYVEKHLKFKPSKITYNSANNE